MLENYIYERGEIKVDKSLARFGPTSYPIANIGSITTQAKPSAGMVLGGIVFLIGLLLCLVEVYLGIAVAVLGVVLGRFAKPNIAIVVRTSSGDQQVYQSKDRIVVEEVLSALHTAVTARG